MQEESKGEPKAYDLPILREQPTFKTLPLLMTNVSGKTVLNDKIAFELVASLTLTVKDLFRFSEKLLMASDPNTTEEQTLQMVDCRTYETR